MEKPTIESMTRPDVDQATDNASKTNSATYNKQEKEIIKNMLMKSSDSMTPNSEITGINHTQFADSPTKLLLANKALYTAFKKFQSEKKTDMIHTLKEFGYEFVFDRQRDTLLDIIAHGLVQYVKNNLEFDPTGYEMSCPNNLEEWYYELGRLVNGEEFSPDALHVIASCCYLNPDIKTIHQNFTVMIMGTFDPQIAIDLFILDNLKFTNYDEQKDNVIESAVSTLFMSQMDEEIQKSVSSSMTIPKDAFIRNFMK